MTAEDVQYFTHDGFKLAYREDGQGEPILLIHGFASSSRVNWYGTSWFTTLTEAGYRVIAIDNRGHGFSQTSHDKSDYTPTKMAGDAAALLDYLNIEKAHIMGYSMGARISAFMAIHYAHKVHSLVFGGLGIGMVTGAGNWEPVAEALLADDITTITNPRGLMFRKFADHTGSDRLALAACVITSKEELDARQMHSISQPTLVAVGSKDEIGGEPQALAALMPDAQALIIPDRDHMLAVGDRVYKKGVVDFLSRHPMT